MSGCRIIQGDCRDRLREIPDNSVHVCVTSPPYWSLRSYLPDHHPDKGREIGLEDTLGEYVASLRGVFEEVRRVLHPLGSLWLNLGDCFAAESGMKSQSPERDSRHGFGGTDTRGTQKYSRNSAAGGAVYRDYGNLKPRDLCGVPWRVAFALQEAGWWLRMDCIWRKPNPKPESVKGRPSKNHEYVFMLSKSERCFYDWWAVKEPWADERQGRDGAKRGRVRVRRGLTAESESPGGVDPSANGGKNRRSVWDISVGCYPGAHTAVMPEELAGLCIKAGASEGGCCPICLAPYGRLLEDGEPLEDQRQACGGDKNGEYHGHAQKDFAATGAEDASAVKARILEGMVEKRTIGWAPMCAHDPVEFPQRCVVLDPFGGTGTTAKAATKFGHDSIIIELNPETIPQAYERNAQGGLGL